LKQYQIIDDLNSHLDHLFLQKIPANYPEEKVGSRKEFATILASEFQAGYLYLLQTVEDGEKANKLLPILCEETSEGNHASNN
jgi:hypothetical protein